MIGPEERALAELGEQAVTSACAEGRARALLARALSGEASDRDLLEIACIAGVSGGVIHDYALSLGLPEEDAETVEGVAMVRVMANIGRDVSGLIG